MDTIAEETPQDIEDEEAPDIEPNTIENKSSKGKIDKRAKGNHTRTVKQQEALNKMLLIRKKNLEDKRNMKLELEQQKTKKINKIIKKEAIKEYKKQVKQVKKPVSESDTESDTESEEEKEVKPKKSIKSHVVDEQIKPEPPKKVFQTRYEVMKSYGF